MTLQETIENICENQIPKEVNGVSTKYVVSVHSLENLGEVVEIAIMPTHIRSVDLGAKMRFTHRVFYEKKLEQDIGELLCMYIRNIIGWTDHRVVKEITLEEWVKSEGGGSE